VPPAFEAFAALAAPSIEDVSLIAAARRAAVCDFRTLRGRVKRRDRGREFARRAMTAQPTSAAAHSLVEPTQMHAGVPPHHLRHNVEVTGAQEQVRPKGADALVRPS
jgi:hypothetical protein